MRKISTGEAARMLGTSRRVVSKWVKDGLLTAIKVSNKYELDPIDVTLFSIRYDRKRRVDFDEVKKNIMYQIFAKINGKWRHVAFKHTDHDANLLVKEILNDHVDNRVHVCYIILPDAHKIDMLNDLVNKA